MNPLFRQIRVAVLPQKSLMPIMKLKETPGPKSMMAEVRMYIIHDIAGYISALFSPIALIYSYVFESKDVQPVISLAAVSLWDVSGMTLSSPCLA